MSESDSLTIAVYIVNCYILIKGFSDIEARG